MKKILVILVVLFAFVAVNTSNAQLLKKYAKKGIWEVGGTVLFYSRTNVSNGQNAANAETHFSFGPNAGYFIMDGLQLGADITFNSDNAGGQNNSTSYWNFMFAPAWVFNTNTMLFPYLKGLVGYNSYSPAGANSTSLSGIAWGIEGGTKIAPWGNGLINVGVRYQQVDLNPSNSTSRTGFNQFSFGAGLSIFL